MSSIRGQALSSLHVFPGHLIGLLILLTLGWGFNWPMMKLALQEMAPMHFRSLCLASGMVGWFAIARFNGLRIAVPRGQWPRLIVISATNMVGWNVLAVYGLPMLSSGRAAILGYTMPMWAVLLSAWLLNEPLTRRRVLGVALGMGGMLLLLGSEIHAVESSPLGAVLLIGAAIIWAFGTIAIKRWPVDLPIASFVAWQMLLALVPIFIVALTTETSTFNPFALSLAPMLGVLYNMLIAFIFCHWAWTKIALGMPVGVSSLASMMTPVVGVFSGALVLSESPHWQDYAALVLVVACLATVMLPARAISR